MRTWIKSNMAPLRRWAPKGRRLKGVCTAWALAYPDLPGGAAPRRAKCALRLRRADRRPFLPGRGRAASGPVPAARRHRHSRQSRQPQGQGGAPDNPHSRCAAVVSASVSAGPQPDQADLCPRSSIGCGTPRNARWRTPTPISATPSAPSNPAKRQSYIRNNG